MKVVLLGLRVKVQGTAASIYLLITTRFEGRLPPKIRDVSLNAYKVLHAYRQHKGSYESYQEAVLCAKYVKAPSSERHWGKRLRISKAQTALQQPLFCVQAIRNGKFSFSKRRDTSDVEFHWCCKQ